MKIAKNLSFAVLVCISATMTTACSWWQDDKEDEINQFYQPDDGIVKARDQIGTGDGFGDDSIDLTGLDGTDGGTDKDGVGEWGEDPGINGADYIEGFGARIPGVEFEPLYFLFDQDLILQTEEYKLNAVVDYLKNNAKAGVVIEGNCDSRGTTEYNRALGEKRAIIAKTYLINHGIAETRIKTVSYGEERPAQPGETEEAHSYNRRDEFVPVYLKK